VDQKIPRAEKRAQGGEFWRTFIFTPICPADARQSALFERLRQGACAVVALRQGIGAHDGVEDAHRLLMTVYIQESGWEVSQREVGV